MVGPETIPTDPKKLYKLPVYKGEIIDVHTHLFPRAMFRAIRSWFKKVEWNIPYPYKTDEVVKILRDFGVVENWALVYAHKAGVAAGLNRWMAGVMEKHENVRGFATIHPDDENPAADLKKAINDRGLQGLKIHAEVQQIMLDDPRLDAAFDYLEETRLPFLPHIGDAPYPFPPPYLDVKFLERRLEKNPKLVTVVAHLGTSQTGKYLELMDRYPDLHLETSFTRFPGYPGAPDFDPDLLAPFADRILFGSDFPNIPFTYADQVAAWWEVDWVRANPEKFFCQNARRLLPPKKIVKI